MVGYNQNQPDVWSAFAGGMEIGGALRRRQQQDQYGEAYQQGGWESVRDTAGGFGDLQTAEGAQGVMDGQEETALARAQRSATVLSNAATSLQGLPYEQRMSRLQQMAPMLQGLGIDEQQLSTFDPTDENLEMVRGIQGQMSQYAEIRQQGDAIVGIRPDGTVEVLREEQPQAPQGYRFAPDGQSMQFIPGGPADPANRPRGGGERTPPSGYEFTPDGRSLRPIPGGPRDPAARVNTFSADQRARTVITYQNALEAAATIDSLESGGYNLSNDWGALAVEGLGGGDPDSVAGGVARQWGGQDFQQMRSASSAFEGALLPILSGAAVVQTEAIRMIRGALPQIGDGPEVQADKRRRRQQMLNGAALINGSAPPYPELGIPDWAQRYIDTQGQLQDGASQGGAAPPAGIPADEWDDMSAEAQQQILDILGQQ
jgi:hypothetical protein